MGSLYKQFATNPAFETDGIRIEYGVTEGGKPIAFKIARAGGQNKLYGKTLERLSRPYKTQLENGTLDDSVAEKLMLEVFCTAILLGWENVEDASGNVMKFSKENAIKLLTDLPDLYDDLRKQSNKVALFRQSELEEDVKN